MVFVEDFSAFFNSSTQGYVQVVLGGLTVGMIFDAAYADPLGIAGTEPRATCISADVSTATLGTSITVNGAAYTVRDKQPDGTGLTVLLLEAA